MRCISLFKILDSNNTYTWILTDLGESLKRVEIVSQIRDTL